MWVRTEPGELVNLDHSHHIHISEHGAPKFHVEVIAVIGSERHVLALMSKIGSDGKHMAIAYVDRLVHCLGTCGKLIETPLMPRHPNQVAHR